MKSTISSQPKDIDLAITSRPTALGRFGKYGWQYVPETLIPALIELEKAANEAWKDSLFNSEYKNLIVFPFEFSDKKFGEAYV